MLLPLPQVIMPACIIAPAAPAAPTRHVQEFLAIQDQQPRNLGFFGTRNMGFMHQQLIEMLSYAMLLTVGACLAGWLRGWGQVGWIDAMHTLLVGWRAGWVGLAGWLTIWLAGRFG